MYYRVYYWDQSKQFITLELYGNEVDYHEKNLVLTTEFSTREECQDRVDDLVLNMMSAGYTGVQLVEAGMSVRGIWRKFGPASDV